MHRGRNVTSDHTKEKEKKTPHTSKIRKFGDPQQQQPKKKTQQPQIGLYDEENPLAPGLKTKRKHNYQPSHLRRRMSFSCSKWAVRINHCSLCEFISCSALSSLHKGIMDHQFASSVCVLSGGHTASTFQL